MVVESTLIKWLKDQTGIEAAHSRPDKDAPAYLFTVQRTGGQRESIATEAPELAIQCWAPTMAEAAKLAEQLDKLMPRFAYEPDIHRVEHLSTYEWEGENR